LINVESWFEYNPDQGIASGYYDSALGESVWWESKDSYTGDGGKEYFDKTYTGGDGYYYRGPYEFVSDKQQQNAGTPIFRYQDNGGNWIEWRDRNDYSWDYSYFEKYYPKGTGYYYERSSYIFVSNVPRHDYSYQPPLSVPGWITDKDPYKDSLVTIDGKSVAGRSTWDIMLIANLIDKNATGLNGALDDAINAVFNNPNFTEAVARTAKLNGKDPVKLDAVIVNAFGLSQFWGDDDVYIGWAELELLLSALKLVKGTLLYVDSYRWDYDISFVKDLPWNASIQDKIDDIAGNLNKVLPFRTGFMTDRGGNYLEDSRKAYVEALTSIVGVYDYYIGNDSKLPSGYKDVLKEYQNYKDEVVKAKNAIDAKGSFTVPDISITINFGKFFTGGQLALDKLIKTEGSGTAKSPVFYGRQGNNTPEKITSLNDIKKKYDAIGFKVTTDSIGEIVGTDLAKYLLAASGFADTDGYVFFDSMYGEIAWAAYHWSAEVKEYFDF
jgi:hypothetical protein